VATLRLVYLVTIPTPRDRTAADRTDADSAKHASRQLPGDGMPVALLLGAGFAVRAVGQFGAIDDSVVRQSLDASTALLYCIGFGYAIQSFSSARYPTLLHFGAAGLLAGTLLGGLVGNTPLGLALCLLGAGLLMLTMAQAAGHGETRFQRVALLVATMGPGLFALHAFAFPESAALLQARFLRLGATAAMALPLLATLYRLDRSRETARATRIARALLGIGMVALPLVLVLSAFVDERLKYGLGPASDCFTVALIIACVQAARRSDGASLAGYGTILASMLLGKAMGFYAFDGPLSAPAALATYGDAWRVALRNFHIDLMVIGYTFLLWPVLVRPRVIAVAGIALILGLSMPAMGAWSRFAGVAAVLWVLTLWRGRATA